MHLSNYRKAVIAILITHIIWGATPPIFKWSLESVQPFTFGFLRFLLASLLLLPLTKFRLKIQRQDFAEIFALAFVGIFLAIGFILVGLTLAPSINAPIIGTAGPIFLILGSIVFLGEKPKTKVTVGTIISLIGVLFILFRALFENHINGSLLGNFFFLMNTLTAIIHLIILKKVVKKYDPLTINFWSFFLGSLLFLPLAVTELSVIPLTEQLKFNAIIGIVFAVIFTSVIAWVFQAYAIKYLPASEIGIFSYLNPIITILVAAPLLGEAITPAYLLGAGLVFIGMYIAEGKIHFHPIHLLHQMSEGLKSVI